MRKLVASLVLTGGLALTLTALSLAGGSQSTTWSTKLTAAQEFPKQAVANTAASGSFTGTLSGDQLTLSLLPRM